MDVFEEDIKDIVKVFKGNLKGIVLSKRGGDNDSHIKINIITEDDENWFTSSNENGFSSYWLNDLQEQLELSKKWMIENCIPDIHDGIQYGYKLK